MTKIIENSYDKIYVLILNFMSKKVIILVTKFNFSVRRDLL